MCSAVGGVHSEMLYYCSGVYSLDKERGVELMKLLEVWVRAVIGD